jgi:hypothetical protein
MAHQPERRGISWCSFPSAATSEIRIQRNKGKPSSHTDCEQESRSPAIQNMHAVNTEIGSNRIGCQQLRPALSLISFLSLNSHPLSAWFPDAGHLNRTCSHPYSLLSVTDISSAVYNHIRSSFRTQVLENGSLLMQDVQKSDSGLFLCRASNGIGTDLSKVIRLTVHGKDIIFVMDAVSDVMWHIMFRDTSDRLCLVLRHEKKTSTAWCVNDCMFCCCRFYSSLTYFARYSHQICYLFKR